MRSTWLTLAIAIAWLTGCESDDMRLGGRYTREEGSPLSGTYTAGAQGVTPGGCRRRPLPVGADGKVPCVVVRPWSPKVRILPASTGTSVQRAPT